MPCLPRPTDRRVPIREVGDFENALKERHVNILVILLVALSSCFLEAFAPSKPDDPAPGTARPLAEDKTGEERYGPPPVRLAPEDFPGIEAADPNKLELDHANRPSITPDQVMPGGQRRVFQTPRVRLTASKVEKLQQSGNLAEIDPQTGERIIDTFRDFLPENWRTHAEPGAWIDSYGNPIVNHADGLPDWAQRDVDALRDAIRMWRDTRREQAAAG